MLSLKVCVPHTPPVQLETETRTYCLLSKHYTNCAMALAFRGFMARPWRCLIFYLQNFGGGEGLVDRVLLYSTGWA